MSNELNTVIKQSEYDVIGNDDERDKKYKAIIDNYVSKPFNEQPLMFGVDIRGSAIRMLMNGTHETAPTIENANSLIIRLMGSMMARFTVMENAHTDDIHNIEPDIKNVVIFVDNINDVKTDDTILRGLRCIRKIGPQAGYHVYIGFNDDGNYEDFMSNRINANDSDNNDDTMITL